MDFEWNIFPGFNTLQLNDEVKCLLLGLGETPENFTGRIIFMTMFNDLSCGSRDNEKECLSNASLVTHMERDLEEDNGHSFALVPRKSGTRLMKTVHKENGTVRRKRFFRATSPLSRGRLKSKGHGKLSLLCSRFGND